jgi:hypothetical protein
VSQIRTVARRDPVLGAEGAVLFLERVSPALISYPRALLVAQRMCEWAGAERWKRTTRRA